MWHTPVLLHFFRALHDFWQILSVGFYNSAIKGDYKSMLWGGVACAGGVMGTSGKLKSPSEALCHPKIKEPM